MKFSEEVNSQIQNPRVMRAGCASTSTCLAPTVFPLSPALSVLVQRVAGRGGGDGKAPGARRSPESGCCPQARVAGSPAVFPLAFGPFTPPWSALCGGATLSRGRQSDAPCPVESRGVLLKVM